MIYTHSSRGLVWLDLESPSDEEIAGIVKRYGLHPLVGEELRSSSSQAKTDFYSDHVLVVLTVPERVRTDTGYTIVDREIDFVIGKNYLITSRFESLEQLEYFAKVFEANAILDKDATLEHPGHLFYLIVKKIYSGMIQDLENIRDELLRAESRIFSGDERNMVHALSGLSRELIDFRQIVRIHRDVWESMSEGSTGELFAKGYSAYIKDIHDEFNRIHELIANARELLADLRETNDSLLNTKQNEIMKVLTLIALVFNPLTFVASVFTIPAAYVPLIESHYGWSIIVTVMMLMVAGTWWVFKKKGWI